MHANKKEIVWKNVPFRHGRAFWNMLNRSKERRGLHPLHFNSDGTVDIKLETDHE